MRSFKLDYRHKKMDLNPQLAKLLSEGNSLRGCSRILGLTYYNTYKKFLWFKKLVEKEKNKLSFKAKVIEFDELESIHHTKCKPLSIVLMVNEKNQLLAAQVAEIPAKGKLAEFSRLKYGLRENQRKQKLTQAFTDIKNSLQAPPVLIKSDASSIYKTQVECSFGGVRYEQYSRRADKNKLQERLHEKLQKKKFDPLFAINHKCAVLRDRINRLTRRSWCTTKKVENLQLHLDIFILSQFKLRI